MGEGPVAGAGVGVGTVGACSDDGLKGPVRCTPSPHGIVDGRGDLPLGRTRVEHGPHLCERLVCYGGGGFDAGKLSGVLDLTQGLHETVGCSQGGICKPASEPALFGPCHGVGLETQVGDFCGKAGKQLLATGHGYLDLDVGTGCCNLSGCLVGVAAVGDQHRPVGIDPEHPGGASEPGQVPDVGGGGDQQCPATGIVKPCPQPIQAQPNLHGREHGSGHRSLRKMPAGPLRRPSPGGSRHRRSRRSCRRQPEPRPKCGATARGRPGWRGGPR